MNPSTGKKRGDPSTPSSPRQYKRQRTIATPTDSSTATLSAPLPDTITNDLGLDKHPQPSGPYLPSLLTTLVNPKIASPESAFSSKVKDRYLSLDNPPRDAAKRKAARLRSKKLRQGKNKKEKLNASDKRRLGVYDVPKEQCKYKLFEPLHELWNQYMKDLLGDSNNIVAAIALPKILKADFHGCLLTVIRSKCPSYIGTTGILFKETEKLFHLVTADDQVKLIPKSNSVFSFSLNTTVFTLFGNHLMSRASERAAKKYKYKFTMDL
ncbi:hypothetical protein SmJEL517_g03926 [Synchytrium microbalum]|uniref:Uncharacterized protein n=1 Tax=Synchytrium microbalum TaxID=1806994 RepID=A0A507BUC2_9FUNG|nr:uncharacterized protein SmJEL517_g03926 [Synchytrium microbalum]TPX33090.1 hypothetical protein SmJEL517_g03926 [Synchytrium microbalum]